MGGGTKGLGESLVPGPTHSSSVKEGRPRATTLLPAGRMRAAPESMREFSLQRTAATCGRGTWRTKRPLAASHHCPWPWHPLRLLFLEDRDVSQSSAVSRTVAVVGVCPVSALSPCAPGA
eukprot:scaffold12322_cov110-Isochrysis_galbana.AAC.6